MGVDGGWRWDIFFALLSVMWWEDSLYSVCSSSQFLFFHNTQVSVTQTLPKCVSSGCRSMCSQSVFLCMFLSENEPRKQT